MEQQNPDQPLTSQYPQKVDSTAIQAWLLAVVAESRECSPAELDVHVPFENLGLGSVQIIGLVGDLEVWLGRELSPTLMYDYPDIATLARYLAGEEETEGGQQPVSPVPLLNEPIAVIGIGCRFPPDAKTPEAFWHFLRNGGDAVAEIPAERWDIERYYDADVTASGKIYTRHGAFLRDVSLFDSAFFGISPREALRMDPQQRLLLEVSWEALEHAGLAPEKVAGSQTGVFIGMMNNLEYAQIQTELVGEACNDDPYFGTGSASSVAAGRLAYFLDVHGPALTVDTACSSALVALHLACQSLRRGECSLALVGGANTLLRPETMANACKMGMLSADGHCKTFDAGADGFALGEGCGVVVLKRLSEAQADQDPILCLVRGSATNQDGYSNGLTAPNRLAQEAVIRRALFDAGLEASEVGYVETHGTGTALGDPIEVAALMNVLGEGRSQEHPLILGAVKANLGHLAAAAGIAGLIKTILVLQQKEIPPHLHLQTPNPRIPWKETAFLVPTNVLPWPTSHKRRIAGVSSFGWSGTNAHALLEEAPLREPSGSPSRPWQMLLLSARTPTALATATDNLRLHLEAHPETSLSDTAFTLQIGRKAFKQRSFLVCRERAEAIRLLEQGQTTSVFQAISDRPVFFLFPGIGEQFAGLTRELYEQEAFFREEVDRCAELLEPLLGQDLRLALYPAWAKNAEQSGPSPLHHTDLAQPTVFVIEYALARMLMHWGLRPSGMLGYSLGEYVAACLAGVLSLEEALRLIAFRAQQIQMLPVGSMLAVQLSETAIQPYLNEEIQLAIINAPQTCVLAGSSEGIAQIERQMLLQEIACQRVATTHAFHSRMLAAAEDALTLFARGMCPRPPHIPYISNVTGDWITPEQATQPAYWASHMCQTVRFADGVEVLLKEQEAVLVEIGPGHALTSFVRQHTSCTTDQFTRVIPTLPLSYDHQGEQEYLLNALGKLWLAGAQISWPDFWQLEQRQRVVLPPYPFEQQRFWPQPREQQKGKENAPDTATSVTESISILERKAEIADWFYQPSWKQAPSLDLPDLEAFSEQKHSWLFFLDDCGIGERLAQRIKKSGQDIITVTPGTGFVRSSEQIYAIHPNAQADYEALFRALRSQGQIPTHIVHLWTTTSEASGRDGKQREDGMLERGLYSLVALAKVLGDLELGACHLTVISNQVYDVLGRETTCPAKATITGPCKVIPQEYSGIRCQHLDLSMPETERRQEQELIDQLLAEIVCSPGEDLVALRGSRRWLPTFEPLHLAASKKPPRRLRKGGVYLITGGLGGIGLALARHLASEYQARLVLLGRRGLPSRHTWTDYLSSHAESDPQVSRIRQVLALEELGSEVMVLAADVTDENAMRAAIAQTSEAFGTLHGVLHAAGLPGVGLIQFKTPETIAQVLAPKMQGTLVLTHVLEKIPLDFLVLFSSIIAITGSPGQVDYCAANAFLDSYAHCHSQEHGLTLSINWGYWQWDAWDEGLAGYGTEAQAFFRENRRRSGIHFGEGIQALGRLLDRNLSHMVVSTQNFQALASLSGSLTAASLAQQEKRGAIDRVAYPRPVLGTSYVPPRNDLEYQIAAIWEELLAIEQIGIKDNFFELGGNSLMGIDLMARLRKALHLETLPVYVLYEAPSVGAIAHYIEQGRNIHEAETSHGRGEKRKERLKQRMRITERVRQF